MYSTLQGILTFRNKDAFYKFFHSLKDYELSMSFDDFRDVCIDEGKMEVRFISGNAINNIHKLFWEYITSLEFDVNNKIINSDSTILRCFSEELVSVFELKNGKMTFYYAKDLPHLLEGTKFRKLFPTEAEYEEACDIGLDFVNNERDSELRNLIDEWVAKVANFEEFNEIEFDTVEDLIDDTKMRPEWIKFFEENHWLDYEYKESFNQKDFLRIFYNSTEIPKDLFLKEIMESYHISEVFEPEFSCEDLKYQYDVFVTGSEGNGFLIITKLWEEN